jgi:hypothetical protein
MPWDTVYLVCFILGLAFSLASVIGGSTHIHLPRGWWSHGGSGHGARGSLVNSLTVTAFLTWFGGTGYLLTQYTRLWTGITLALTLLTGLAVDGVPKPTAATTTDLADANARADVAGSGMHGG